MYDMNVRQGETELGSANPPKGFAYSVPTFEAIHPLVVAVFPKLQFYFRDK